jgi:hypothetical protein
VDDDAIVQQVALVMRDCMQNVLPPQADTPPLVMEVKIKRGRSLGAMLAYSEAAESSSAGNDSVAVNGRAVHVTTIATKVNAAVSSNQPPFGTSVAATSSVFQPRSSYALLGRPMFSKAFGAAAMTFKPPAAPQVTSFFTSIYGCRSEIDSCVVLCSDGECSSGCRESE